MTIDDPRTSALAHQVAALTAKSVPDALLETLELRVAQLTEAGQARHPDPRVWLKGVQAKAAALPELNPLQDRVRIIQQRAALAPRIDARPTRAIQDELDGDVLDRPR